MVSSEWSVICGVDAPPQIFFFPQNKRWPKSAWLRDWNTKWPFTNKKVSCINMQERKEQHEARKFVLKLHFKVKMTHPWPRSSRKCSGFTLMLKRFQGYGHRRFRRTPTHLPPNGLWLVCLFFAKACKGENTEESVIQYIAEKLKCCMCSWERPGNVWTLVKAVVQLGTLALHTYTCEWLQWRKCRREDRDVQRGRITLPRGKWPFQAGEKLHSEVKNFLFQIKESWIGGWNTNHLVVHRGFGLRAVPINSKDTFTVCKS